MCVYWSCCPPVPQNHCSAPFLSSLQTPSFQGRAVFCARGVCFCAATFGPIIPSSQGTVWFLLWETWAKHWCIPFWLMLLTVLSQEELSQNFSLCSRLCLVSSVAWLSTWRIWEWSATRSSGEGLVGHLVHSAPLLSCRKAYNTFSPTVSAMVVHIMHVYKS